MKKLFEFVAESEQRIRLELIEKIKALPDNPLVQPVGSKAFSINWKDLSNNLSPEYYSWKAQHRMMIEELESSTNITATMERWLTEKKIRTSGRNYFNIHPGVVNQIQSIWET